jgi:DNA polymerase III epsilon subunit family exonuclease
MTALPGAPSRPAPPRGGPRARGAVRGAFLRRRLRARGLLPRELADGADLVVVDIETTGWLADEARITEIGAVRIGRGRPVAEFSSLVNPGVVIPDTITALTGITDAMVSTAPPIGEVLPRFLHFAGGGVIAAHNAPFDVAFLAAACRSCGLTWPPGPVIDTVALSRLVLRRGEVPDHKLGTLAGHFAIAAPHPHRALADASVTLSVLASLFVLVPSSGVAAIAGCEPEGGPRTATMAPQPGRGLPGLRRRLWSRRSC